MEYDVARRQQAPRQQRGGQKPSDAAFPALARLPGARKPLIVDLQAADVARLVSVGPNKSGKEVR